MLTVDKLNLKENMSDGERSIADYLLSKGREIAKYSTRGLAEATYTSPATVIRLCKKLGFSGFDAFKAEFLKELEYLEREPGAVDFNFPFEEGDSPMKVANRISSLYAQTIQDTMSLLRYDELKKAVALLKYHSDIHVFSAGTAINQAESFREKMLKIGKRVFISNNLNYQLYEAGCLGAQDAAIIISYSGETRQIVQIAKECRRCGTPIIALTSFSENTLSHYAACKLTLSTKESIYCNLGDYSSHLSVSLLLDILYSAFFLQNYEQNYQQKLNKARVLERDRTSTNPILMDLDKMHKSEGE
ncbi:MAG: MurR/RpiR family transcriptional regulator [Gemmiger sp.]